MTWFTTMEKVLRCCERCRPSVFEPFDDACFRRAIDMVRDPVKCLGVYMVSRGWLVDGVNVEDARRKRYTWMTSVAGGQTTVPTVGKC